MATGCATALSAPAVRAWGDRSRVEDQVAGGPMPDRLTIRTAMACAANPEPAPMLLVMRPVQSRAAGTVAHKRVTNAYRGV